MLFKDKGKSKTKSILVVNTGPAKKEFIFKKLHSLGLRIYCLHREKNWAQKYADQWIIADTNNEEESLAALKEFLKVKKIDGVITFWEQDVELAAKICEQYGFAGNSYEVANKVRNKYKFRSFCQKHSLPYPKYKVINQVKDLSEVVASFVFPLVIKPKVGSNSLDVQKVENPKELLKVYRNLVKKYHQGEILIEEFLAGPEVDLDILVQAGQVKFCGISDNKMMEPYFVEMGRVTPSQLSQRQQEELIQMAEKVLGELGVINSLVHFEARYTSKGPVPIEVNLRLGGDEVYPSTKKAWNVDLIEGAVRIALGLELPVKKFKTITNKCLVSYDFLAQRSGKFSAVKINSKLKSQLFYEKIQFLKNIGDQVLAPPQGWDYLGWVMVSGKDYQEARQNLDQAVGMVRCQIRGNNRFSSGLRKLKKILKSEIFTKIGKNAYSYLTRMF